MTISRVKAGRETLLPFGLFCFLIAIALPAAASDRAASFLPIEEEPTAVGTTAPAALGTSAPMPEGTTPEAPPPMQPVDPGIPVESMALSDINPESVGLLTPEQSGLGAALWKATQHLLAERLLPALNLPTSSPALNDLARRFLLTTAAVPEGEAQDKQSLVALRVERLLALGDAPDAWKLALAARPELIDEAAWHRVAEAALAGGAGDEVCAKLPEIMKTRADPEWEKMQAVCQLRAGDSKAAQVNLDLLHAQNLQDPAFFELAERVIIGGGKQLPRQLTPLKPLILALLRLADLPVRGEVYGHPDAALVPELLRTKPAEDNARLALAERAAQRGLIPAATLEDVYKSQNFPNDELNAAIVSHESGARLHALLFQAALQEKKVPARVEFALRMLGDAGADDLNGALPKAAADAIGDVQPAAEFGASSADLARLYILAGKPETALAWLKLAIAASAKEPKVADQLPSIWPLVVIAGLESAGDYPRNREIWLEDALKSVPDAGAARTQAAKILLLLDATGFAVTPEDWAKVAGAGAFEKHNLPPAFIMERLRAASTGNRRGETVLFALLAKSDKDPAFSTTLETIRALRQVGLTADAAGLAREAVVGLAMPPAKP